MEPDTDPLDWRFGFLVALPNFGVIGVWVFTAFNEWYLHTEESVPLYSLAIFGGGLASLFGSSVCVVGLCERMRTSRDLWLMNLGINAAGLAANFAGFVISLAPGM